MATVDLQWPMRGVIRRNSLRSTPNGKGPFPAPWAVNVRVDDPLDRRLRGGSRPGLTKYVSTDFGTTITDLASINVSRSTGASAILLVLVDSSIKTVENGTVATPVAYLTDESGNILTDQNENRITVSSGTAPSTGFLITGQQHVFAVTTSAIVKMDPKTGQVDNLSASAGSIPTSCTLGAIYRDRMVLAGADNAIYMSKQGDYTDWDYGQHVDNQGRALAFQLSLGAGVGALCTAAIPHKDAFLVCATARTLWVVQGDPAADGSLRRISENVGIIHRKAWCRVDDSIVFLSTAGLYMMQADGSNLTALSPETVPDELRDIDTSTTTVSIGYEEDRAAFHIYLRTNAGSNTHWLYEVQAQAFWPMRLQDNHSPRAVCQHEGELLLAGNDGYIRYVGGTNDDGAAIQSHVVLGPFRLGKPGYFGRMLNMHGMLAAGGGTVNWRLVSADTAEEAADNAKAAIEAFQSGSSYSSYVQGSGNWISGRAVMVYPRVRAVWCCLWLQSTNRWAYEGVTVTKELSGMWRGSSAGVVVAGVVSPSSSPSASPTSTPSASRSTSPSTSPSASVSSSPSASPSASVSSTPSASVSSSPSTSPSASVSSSPSASTSSSVSSSPSASVSSSPSHTPSASASSSPSHTPSSSRSASVSSSPSASRSSSPSASASSSPSSSPSVSPSST